MRTSLILFFLVSSSSIAAQISISKAGIDSIGRYNYQSGTQLEIIAEFNRCIKFIGLDDTITVTRGEIEYKYYTNSRGDTADCKVDFNLNYIFKEKVLNSIHDGPISIMGSTMGYKFIIATVNKSPSEHYRIIINKNDNCDTKIKVQNYYESVLIGEYFEKCITGEVYHYGNYIQVDSSYQDTIITFDPDTYDETVNIFNRTKWAVKCGEWIETDEKGRKAKQQYIPCSE